MTAYSRFEYARKALKLEAADYLVKPYSVRTLDETMGRHIRRITLDEVADVSGTSKYHLSRTCHSDYAHLGGNM